MKIAFAGDWHGNWKWARHAISHAAEQEADTIVHLGDYGYDFTRTFRESIEYALKYHRMTLQFVDGNHEDFPKLYGWPIGEDGRRQISDRVHHLPRGYRWELEGVRFLAMGGAFSVDRQWRVLNESWWMEETISDEQIQTAVHGGGEVDVLVSHDCPKGVHIPGLEKGALYFPHEALVQANEHRYRLTDVVDAVRPRFIWHGHYHRAYSTITDLGYGDVEVYGLDMDGTTLESNIMIVNLDTLSR